MKSSEHEWQPDQLPFESTIRRLDTNCLAFCNGFGLP